MSLVVDTSNTMPKQTPASSTATLASNAVFTAPWLPTSDFGKIVGGVNADQAGTLVVNQGYDASHISAKNTVAVTANTPTPFVLDVVDAYFQVVYTNGATGQGSFALQVSLRRT